MKKVLKALNDKTKITRENTILYTGSIHKRYGIKMLI